MLLIVAACRTAAQAAGPTITWGAFVDGYFAYDFGRPPSFDRSLAGGVPFTTQPARHNEFNVNLAFVEAKLESQRARGRLALQVGTSVQSNYSGEPSNGTVSGPSLSRLIQEAVAGIKVAEKLWIDGGIFFSHLGTEGWISRDNPTYTRSLVAEYSPYYSSGVRAVLQGSEKLTAQLHVVNGWQNISESNSDKGVGLRVDYAPSSRTTLSYYNFFSNEGGTANRLRTFNGIGAKTSRGRLSALAQFDYGTQEAASGSATSWYGIAAIGRVQFSPRAAVVVREERFDDEEQTIIVTGLSDPFRGNGASIGFDWAPVPGTLWRSEVRGWRAGAAIFPDGAAVPRKSSTFIVTSLALTL